MSIVTPFDPKRRKPKPEREPEGPMPDCDWETAPIRCMGVSGETWWFVDGYRQLVGLRGAALASRGALATLLAGHGDWAARHWPERNKEGEPTGRFQVHAMHEAIARQQAKVGLFDPAMPRRMPGVWSDHGKMALHVGDAVLTPGEDGWEERRTSFVERGVAWIACSPAPRPGDAAEAAVAARLEELWGGWNWDRKASPRMALGLLTLANLGALPPMRPYGLIAGQEGSGKTLFLDMMAALSPVGHRSNDTSEAGLRQTLAVRAGPAFLDEAEGEAFERVLGLVRRIVTGDGMSALRGTAGQQSVSQVVAGTAILAAIAPPVANAAEETRCVALNLWPRAPEAVLLDRLALLAWAEERAPALWGRMLAAWPRIGKNAGLLKGLAVARGCSPRHADRIAWVVAAREAMVRDEALHHDEADEALDWAAEWIVTEAEQAEDTTAARCMSHLMASTVTIRPGEERTIAVLLRQAAETAHEANERLAQIGLRRASDALLVAGGRRPGLQRVYAGTEWAGGRWGGVLAQLRGVVGGAEVRAGWTASRVRFSGDNDRARAVAIPLSLLSSPEKPQPEPEDWPM